MRSWRAAAGARLLRSWQAAVGAGLLLVLSNGPVLRFATGVLNRPGHWNDWAVWPFFAGAAAASAVLAWATWRPAGRAPGPAGRAATPAPLSRPALGAIAWYSAAAVVSSLWSVYASATLWRSVVYLGLILLAVALARLTDDELSTALVLLASVAVAGSLAVIVLQHDVGTDRHGNWIGMYTNRNSLAPLAAFGAIAGLWWLLPGSNASPASRACGATDPHQPRPRSGRHCWDFRDPPALQAQLPLHGDGSGARCLLAVVVGDPDGCGQPHRLVGAGSCAGPGRGHSVPRRRAQSRVRRWGPWRTGATVFGGTLVAVGTCVAVAAAAWNVPTLSQRRAIWSLVWDRVLGEAVGRIRVLRVLGGAGAGCRGTCCCSGAALTTAWLRPRSA